MHADVHLCSYRTPRVVGQDEIHPLPSVFALPQFLNFAVNPYLASSDPIEALHETPDGHVTEGISEEVEIHVYGGAAHRIGDLTHDHAALDRHLVVEASVLDGLEDYVVRDLGIRLARRVAGGLQRRGDTPEIHQNTSLSIVRSMDSFLGNASR